jgi:hypothetical protein
VWYDNVASIAAHCRLPLFHLSKIINRGFLWSYLSQRK